MNAPLLTRQYLLRRLEDELRHRNVKLAPDARRAIENEFTGRHQRANNADDVLELWDKNIDRYVDLLDQMARDFRTQHAHQPDEPVTLTEPLVRQSFAACGPLCPGPV